MLRRRDDRAVLAVHCAPRLACLSAAPPRPPTVPLCCCRFLLRFDCGLRIRWLLHSGPDECTDAEETSRLVGVAIEACALRRIDAKRAHDRSTRCAALTDPSISTRSHNDVRCSWLLSATPVSRVISGRRREWRRRCSFVRSRTDRDADQQGGPSTAGGTTSTHGQ